MEAAAVAAAAESLVALIMIQISHEVCGWRSAHCWLLSCGDDDDSLLGWGAVVVKAGEPVAH